MCVARAVLAVTESVLPREFYWTSRPEQTRKGGGTKRREAAVDRIRCIRSAHDFVKDEEHGCRSPAAEFHLLRQSATFFDAARRGEWNGDG